MRPNRFLQPRTCHIVVNAYTWYTLSIELSVRYLFTPVWNAQTKLHLTSHNYSNNANIAGGWTKWKRNNLELGTLDQCYAHESYVWLLSSWLSSRDLIGHYNSPHEWYGWGYWLLSLWMGFSFWPTCSFFLYLSVYYWASIALTSMQNTECLMNFSSLAFSY